VTAPFGEPLYSPTVHRTPRGDARLAGVPVYHSAIVDQRTDEDWEVLTRAAIRWLEQMASMTRRSSYTRGEPSLEATYKPPAFDFDYESERGAMGTLPGP